MQIKMGRQPRSGDIPWLQAHSILNWIGGDTPMLILFPWMSRFCCRFLRRVKSLHVAKVKQKAGFPKATQSP